MKQVIEKNEKFKTLLNISKFISGKETTTDDLIEDVKINDFIHFKYVPISSVGLEWSYSLHKSICKRPCELPNGHSLLSALW